MNVKNYVRALLCLYLTLSIHILAAQALKVGDRLPEELWNLPLQVVNHPEGKETITLSEYKDKLIILDFWATWCGPCIKSMEKLDSVQRHIGSALAVIPISNEKPEKVTPFLQKRKMQLSSVVNGEFMMRFFPHKGIPHQVWITGEKVYAITGGNYSASDYFKKLIEGQDVKMIAKEEEMSFDPESLFELKTGIRQESGLMGQVNNGLGSRFSLRKTGLVYTNTSAEELFKAAYRKDFPFIEYGNRIVWELPDSLVSALKFPRMSYLRTYEEDSVYNEWLKKHTYTYYSRYAEPQIRSELFRKMQEDVSSYFRSTRGIGMHIEKRVIPCYVLRKIQNPVGRNEVNARVEYQHEFKDTPLNVVARNLGKYLTNQTRPVIDETSSKERVTIKLTSSFQEIEALQLELLGYGLELSMEEREMDIMVFKIISSDKI